MARVAALWPTKKTIKASAAKFQQGEPSKPVDHQRKEAIRRRDKAEEMLAEVGRSYNVRGGGCEAAFMNNTPDGFYTVYLSGKAGNGFSMFTIRHGVIVGADMLGAIYDGQLEEDGTGGYKATLAVKLPPNMSVIQGGTTGPHGDSHHMTFELPTNFLSVDFVRINGKLGPINAKFVKIRGLDD